MKYIATIKYSDGKLVVEVYVEECTVSWFFVGKDKEVHNHGQMDIEMYSDGTWLPYWETHRPSRKIPTIMKPSILKLFHKASMRYDKEVE